MRPTKSRFATEAACLAVGAALGILSLCLLAGKVSKFKADQEGFAVNSSLRHDSFEGRPVSANFPQFQKAVESLREFKAGGRRTALWLGASQLYTIVDCGPEDKTAVWHADTGAAKNSANTRYAQMAEPNANFNELLAMYLAALNKGVKPDLLILGMVYDDLKETGIRPEIIAELGKLPHDFLEKNSGEIFKDAVAAAGREKEGGRQSAAPVKRVETEETNQAVLEGFFERNVERMWDAFRERPRMRAFLESKAVAFAAQMVFKFKGRPPVRVPSDLENWTMAAYRKLVEVAKRDGVEVFVYKAPHRPGLNPFFHVREEYDEFFRKFEKECADAGVAYADFETIVPAELWQGRTQLGFPDVFHFTGGAHKILGGAIFEKTGGKAGNNAL